MFAGITEVGGLGGQISNLDVGVVELRPVRKFYAQQEIQERDWALELNNLTSLPASDCQLCNSGT